MGFRPTLPQKNKKGKFGKNLAIQSFSRGLFCFSWPFFVPLCIAGSPFFWHAGARGHGYLLFFLNFSVYDLLHCRVPVFWERWKTVRERVIAFLFASCRVFFRCSLRPTRLLLFACLRRSPALPVFCRVGFLPADLACAGIPLEVFVALFRVFFGLPWRSFDVLLWSI